MPSIPGRKRRKMPGVCTGGMFKGPVLAIMLRAPLLYVVLVFTVAMRPLLLLKSSILAANNSLRIFNITKMAAKRSQRAMLNGQYRVFELRFDWYITITVVR